MFQRNHCFGTFRPNSTNFRWPNLLKYISTYKDLSCEPLIKYLWLSVQKFLAIQESDDRPLEGRISQFFRPLALGLGTLGSFEQLEYRITSYYFGSTLYQWTDSVAFDIPEEQSLLQVEQCPRKSRM